MEIGNVGKSCGIKGSWGWEMDQPTDTWKKQNVKEETVLDPPVPGTSFIVEMQMATRWILKDQAMDSNE